MRTEQISALISTCLPFSIQLALRCMACRLRGQILPLGSPCILDQCRSDRPDVPQQDAGVTPAAAEDGGS